ncbi:heptaprenyl diphosphate synthase component 1 [Staphylococcus sp. 17KM0847]|uniref:heptaprenyl diphosphate synthase component 1 n=1 Tax=Staphylococcus sp. 17KM0847 TaxID=2583989 RepID=UPI0015DC76AE|nr:heptaprenyl diphosphate synthase component 1 [Staphylococcus sp. 17KM0847]QLK86135.1 hypothetical protein FGL66_05110 [Staphylococcus sp. 17KM0847]
MEHTYQILEQQINQRLSQLHKPSNIHISTKLSQTLDQLNIPLLAKLACLSIDTSMKHLDRVSYDGYERDAILIGDLLSAHYYTLLSELKAPHFQLKMSEAIVRINELKSQIQHQYKVMKQPELVDAIYHIETLLLQQILDVYIPNEDPQQYLHSFILKLDCSDLRYLGHLKSDDLKHLLQLLKNIKYNEV